MPKEEEEEFELVPISPIRRLERRLARIEQGKGGGGGGFDSSKFFSELVEIVRMNQQIVDELAKANDAMRIEISRLPGKMDELINNLSELISYIKASAGAAEAEAHAGGGANMEPLLKKMDQLIDANKKIVESNESMMSSMEQLSSKMRKPSAMRPLKRLPPLRKR